MNSIELRKYIKENMFNKNGQRKSTAYFKHIQEDLFALQEEGETFQEKLYLFYFDVKIPQCKTCGKPTKFIKLSQGFRPDYCSSKCAANDKKLQEKRKQTVKEKYGVDYITQSRKHKQAVKEKYLNKLKDGEYNKKVVDKRRKTVKDRYGVDSVAKVNEFTEKRVNTSLKKFGRDNYNNREKAGQTNLKKYGYKQASKNDAIKRKIIETNNHKYGANSFTQSPDGKKAIVKTNLERYGVENTFQSEEIKNKIRSNNQEKYGVDWFVQTEEFKELFKKTSIKRYGVDHPMHFVDVINNLKQNQFNKFYDLLINSNRLSNMVIPLFSKADYSGCNELYDWKCCNCGEKFRDSIDDGRIPRCPVCFPKNRAISNLEKEVAEYVKSLGIQLEENNRTVLDGKELDIYLPSHNLAIEFDGIYWHSELQGKNKTYHLDKTSRCESKNIKLIHIFEDEWLDKSEIIKSIIKSNLGFSNKLYARNCVIKEIENAKDFFNENHLQGYKPGKNIGLYYEDELVSCVTFGKSRYDKKYDWEILRYANKLNTSVVGGFARLLKHFRNNNPGSIITYADRRFFDGRVYEDNGFTFSHTSNPNYYYTDYEKRYNRQKFQKHKLKDTLEIFDENLTEWENMQLNGWDRVWDCGNNCYVLQ